MAKIFVSIAAYRDPELLPTLENLLSNAANPNNLIVCIAWQHAKEDTWDKLTKYKKDPRFKIIDIPYQEAKGVCSARSMIQQHYTNEDFYLQLDSHHRFEKNWDTTLIDHLNYLRVKGHKKPILSSYLPGYFPKTDPIGRNIEVWGLNIDRFMPAGVPFLRPHHIADWEKLKEPFPTRFLSGHFIFSLGKFVLEVPYDPNLYFHGEESSLAARAFTSGYDLFSPHKPIIWHEYTREGKTKHWDDSKDWSDRDKNSYTRFRKIFDMDEVPCSPCQRKSLGAYGLGSERSLQEYERYAGLKFKTRQIHQETLNSDMPPLKGDYESGLASKHKVCIDLYKGALTEIDYDAFAIAILDKDGNDIYRLDANAVEIQNYLNSDTNDKFIHIWREYESSIQPHKWRVWPHSISKGWTDKIENIIGYE
jgi:hypothetical protein